MKKAITVCIMIMLICSLSALTLAVFAESSARITCTVSDASPAPGGEITVTVTVSGAPAAESMALQFEYGDEVFTAESGEWTLNGTNMNNYIAGFDPSKKTAVASYPDSADLNGSIFTLVLKVAENAASGSKEITVTPQMKNGTEDIQIGPAAVSVTVSGSSEPSFKTQSVLLTGQIGVNFYMDLDALTDKEKAESYMTFKISGKGEVSGNPVNFNASQMNPAGTYYGFTCYVNSIQMADTVTATFHYQKENDEKRTITKEYSVKEYIQTVEEMLEEDPEAFDEKTVNLIHALADYGHYVQLFLSGARDWELGDGDNCYKEMDLHYTMYYDLTNILDTIRTIYNCRVSVSNHDSNIANRISYALVLDSETAIRVYLTPAEGYAGETVTFDYIDGNGKLHRDNVSLKNERWMYDIANIPAHRLGDTVKIDAYTGEVQNGYSPPTMIIDISPMSYVLAVLESEKDDDEIAKDAVASIFAYCQAAEAYKEAHENQ